MSFKAMQASGFGRIRIWKELAIDAARQMRRSKAANAVYWLIGRVIYAVTTKSILLTRAFFFRHQRVSRFFQPVTDLARDSKWAQEFQHSRLQWLKVALGEPPVAPQPFSNGKPLVVLVTGTLGPGGSERQVVNTAIGLRSSDAVRVIVLCQALRHDADRFFINDLEASGLEVCDLARAEQTFQRFSGFSNPFKQIAVGLSRTGLNQIEAYAAFFAHIRPSVVHTWLDEINVKAGLGAVLAGVPRVLLGCRSVAPYNFLIYKRYMYPAYRALLERRNVRMLCNSVAGRSSYAAWLSVPEHHVAVVRNGFGSDFFDPPPGNEVEKWISANALGSAGTIVGTVTRFNEEKNPFLWVKFAVRLANRDPRIQFVMVGGGPLLGRVKKYASRAGIGDRIKFTGLSRETKVAMAAFDVFVFTSRLEGLPNAVIEAQARGVPVVMTNAGGSPEAIVPGVTGIVVGDANPQALADAAWKVISDVRWRDNARRKAAEFARRTFSMSDMAENTMANYGLQGPGWPASVNKCAS